MRWSICILCVLFMSALDASVGSVFEIGGIRAQFLPATVVFICLSAPKRVTLPTILSDGSTLVVIGPRVLGFALGALAVVPLRGLLYRQNPLSAPIATMLFSLLASLVFIAVWIVRSLLLDTSAPWWPSTGASELMLRLGAALGDGLMAIVVFWVLNKTRPLWGFANTTRVSPGAARQGL
jgi:hypothetical protein